MSTWRSDLATVLQSVTPFYTLYSRRLAASYDLLYRLGKHYEKPVLASSVTSMGRVPANDVVAIEKPFWPPSAFRAHLSALPAGRPADRRVLVVAPLVGALRHFAARHGPHAAAQPRPVPHRLDDPGWCLWRRGRPSGRLRSTM